jgi:hypothetical protein
MDIINYRVSVDNVSEIIGADNLVYMKKTGQTLFYVSEKLVHIAPASAFVSSTYEKTEIIKALENLNQDVYSIVRKSKEYFKENEGKMMEDSATSFQRGRLNVSEQIFEKLENIKRRFNNY